MTTSHVFKFVTGSLRHFRVPQYLKKAEVASKSELAAKMRAAKGFYKLEMAPPTSAAEMQRLREDLALAMKFVSSGAFKFMTVKQAWLLFLVVNEVWLWFYLGETIGKGRIVGYVVKRHH